MKNFRCGRQFFIHLRVKIPNHYRRPTELREGNVFSCVSSGGESGVMVW